MLAAGGSPAVVTEVRRMRQKLEEAATPRSLKRGRGGLTDVEFLVQLLQLRHGREHAAILCPNVWGALDAIEAANLLPPDDAKVLRDGYSFLRLVEARLRIVTDRSLTEIPDDASDLAKLARRLGFEPEDDASATDQFLENLERVRASVRRVYDDVTGLGAA
jgi:glutamate-ammonia-ligase adenylyltransferase